MQTQNTDTQHDELRHELMDQVNIAIDVVREKCILLNDREKEYLRNNSPVYRKLVDAIWNWKASR